LDYYKLDEKDIIILENLSKDSRMKLSSLADLLGTSIPTISSRITKLEALGIIQRFTLQLGYDLLSEHPSYMILIKVDPKFIETFISKLNNMEEVLEVHELIGSFQILIKTIPLSMQDYNKLISDMRSYSGIIEINPNPIATTFKQDISKLPKQDFQVKLRCEYVNCGKLIEKDYQTLVVDDVTHFFCCKSCLGNYQTEIQASKIEK